VGRIAGFQIEVEIVNADVRAKVRSLVLGR